MKSWVLTLIGVGAAAAHVLSEVPGIVGQVSKAAFSGLLVFLGGGAVGTASLPKNNNVGSK